MTTEAKIAAIKSIMNIPESDTSLNDKLSSYLDLAEREIIQWLYSQVGVPTTPEVPERYEVTQIYSVVVSFTIEGAEGQTSHSENGIARVFRFNTMVDYIRKNVIPYARIK